MSTESNTGVDRPANEGDEWRRLEAAVRSLLDEHEVLRRRAATTERRIVEIEAALDLLSSGRVDPVELTDQLREAERENRLLTERIDHARLVVDRIQARLHFLEVDA